MRFLVFQTYAAAGNALSKMLPKLYFQSQLERSPVTDLYVQRISTFSLWPEDRSVPMEIFLCLYICKHINANLSHVVHQIVQLLSRPHPPAMIKGCYQALTILARDFSFSRSPVYPIDGSSPYILV